MVAKKTNVKNILIISSAIILVFFAYAIIRYNVLKGVPFADLPLFISNKAISVSSVGLIALSYSLGSLSKLFPKTFTPLLSARKYLGLVGFSLAAIHVVISLLLFNSSYYPKFFDKIGQLSLVGELSMLFGVLSLMVFSVVAITSIPSIAKSLGNKTWLRIQRFGYLGLVLILLHVLVMGFQGWMKTSVWPGGMLPISLVASIIIMLTLFLRVVFITTNYQGGKR